jgi:hypothetical protein
VPGQDTAAALLCLTNELFGQPSLADARLPQDYRGASASAQCSAEGFAQRGELFLSVDQRRMTGRAEESGARFMWSRLSPALARRDDGPAAGNDLTIDAPRFFRWLYPKLPMQGAHARLVLTQRVPEAPLPSI